MAEPVITWGVLPDELFDRVVVCSPHFDDAALGAAHLLSAWNRDQTSLVRPLPGH